MNKFCLAISGQKNSGKDLTKKIIEPLLNKEFNTTFKQVAFAQAVKDILCLFHYKNENYNIPVTREFIEEFKNLDVIPEGWNMTVRDSLVNIGDRLREIYPNIWIDLALKNNQNYNKIITDVRYPNELIELKKIPTTLMVRIIRKDFQKKEGDRSEISLNKYDKKIPPCYEGECNFDIPYDYVLRNDRAIKELKYKIQYELFPFICKKWKYFI